SVDFTQVPWQAVALGILLVISATAVVRANTRLGASIGLAATGFLVSLMFVVFRSPDILLTQILIETVSTIFILLILFFMPSFKVERDSPMRKMVNIGVSAAVGFTFFILLLLSMTFRTTDKIGNDYLAKAWEGTGGQNAVNVVIVDFRAIDTTGEICVLVAVGLAVYGMLRSRRKTT